MAFYRSPHSPHIYSRETQVANHATHHLGQMLTLIRQAGYSPVQADWTDLILFYLQRFPPPGTQL